MLEPVGDPLGLLPGLHVALRKGAIRGRTARQEIPDEPLEELIPSPDSVGRVARPRDAGSGVDRQRSHLVVTDEVFEVAFAVGIPFAPAFHHARASHWYRHGHK